MKSTTNYDQFSYVESNRSIRDAHVVSLMELLKKHDFLQSRPIIVNKKHQVLDGQHRLEACRRMGIPVYYEVVHANGHSEDLIIYLNKSQQIWRLNEYVHHWAVRGVPFYTKLLAFEMEHKTGITNAIAICSGQMGGGSLTREIKKGKNMRFNSEAAAIVQFSKNFSKVDFGKTAFFTRAIVVMWGKTTKADREKILRKQLVIKRQASTADYLTVFENIINKNRPATKRISLTV